MVPRGFQRLPRPTKMSPRPIPRRPLVLASFFASLNFSEPVFVDFFGSLLKLNVFLIASWRPRASILKVLAIFLQDFGPLGKRNTGTGFELETKAVQLWL